MKNTIKLLLLHLFLSFLSIPGNSQTIIFDEEAHGIWSKENSPYIVLRDIVIPSDSVLIIEPGVEVEFATGYGMKVYGNLLAVGEDNDQIIFTSADTTAVKNDSILGWNGITILGENTDTSLIENCVIEHVYANQDAYGIVQSAVNVQNRHVSINKCNISRNMGHYGGGIFCEDEGDVLISNSVISANSGVGGGTYAGILIRHSNAEIVNNLISDNGIGILILYTNENSDTVKVFNNTIVQNNPFSGANWYANVTALEALVKFRNCIIWNNPYTNYDTEELVVVSKSDYVEFENCIIPGGYAAFYSEYEANIVCKNVYDIDPFFADVGTGNFQLSDSSYGINGGRNHSPDILSLMPFDLTGNPRIYDDNDDIIDIGAYEFQGTSVNRTPVINNPGTRHILVSTSKEMVFSFSDGDADDTHTLSVYSNSPDITIGELSSQTNNATYTIDPVPGWTGEADVVLTVTDNHGTQDIDTFKFVVSDTVNYTIDDYTVWDVDTVYIAGDIEVSSGATLEIREGTCVQFMGYYNMQVYGVIKAIGTPGNKIRFTSSDTSGYSQGTHTGWGGIRIQNNNDSSVFNSCIFEYVKDNSVLRTDEGTAVEIVNCIFKNNITDDYYYYVIEARNSSVFIGNCIFFDNKHNRTIYTYYTDIKMYNNTFCNNDVRDCIGYIGKGDVMIKNSICWNNLLLFGRNLSIHYDADVDISNCIMETGESSISYSGSNITKGSVFDTYPQFVDSLNRNYRLQANSPCINKGTEDTQVLRLNNIDIDGNDRIFNGLASIPDIGAYEYQGDPVNRAPVLEMVQDRRTLSEVPVNVSAHYYDADETDTHTITILSDDANVDVQDLTGDTTGSVYTLVPAPGYNDTALISVIVEDNGGLKDSIAYNLVVDPCACGIIYQDMVWDDTINIVCDVLVENDATLAISPGTKVIFHGPYSLNINGTLKAVGAENDTIRFILSDTITFNDTIHYNAWKGIRFNPDEEQDTSEIRYCEIRNSKEHGLVFGYRSRAIVTDCNIHHNLADDINKNGAGIYINNSDYLMIENNFIHHNTSTYEGGGIHISSPYNNQILNNTISYNTARNGAGIYSNSYSSMGSNIEGNIIENNSTTYNGGGGIYSHAHDTIRNNIIRNNYSYSSGGGIHGYKYCVIINNTIDGNICNNENTTYGGGVYVYAGNFKITNNLIINNYASTGGAGVYSRSVNGMLANNTICKNITDNKGNALYLTGSKSPGIINNILWGNSSPASRSQIYIDAESLQPIISNCIIEGGKDSISYAEDMYFLKAYSNNIDKDPYFLDFVNDNYNLTDSSICINSGIEDATGSIPEVDIAGNDRIFNGALEKIDIGAYEFTGEPVNRPPCLEMTEDLLLLSSQTKQMKVEYIDPDNGDAHTLTIASSDPNLSVQNISGDTTNSTYDVVAGPGWQGTANIKLKVEDNGGLSDSINYSVIVDDTICGDIGDRTVWDKDTIVISCNVIVPEHKTLTILPGTVVLFTGGNSISVYGTLNAEGTDQDSIDFIIHDTSGIYSHWGGIDFYRNSLEDTSKLTCCNMNYSYNFRIESDKVVVSNCNFDHCYGSNGGAIYIINSSPLIENCVFTNNSASNTGGAISCIDEDYFDDYDTKPILKGNEFYFNNAGFGGTIYCRESDARIINNNIHNNYADHYGGAIYLRECDDPLLNNNLMYKNSTSNGGAIYSYHSRGYFLNNTIVKNKSTVGGGFAFTKYSPSRIYNNIIYYNEAEYTGNQICLEDDDADPSFYNCFIQYGPDSITGDGAGHEYTGYFVNNLSADPVFKDTTNNNYQLSDSSFCINAGTMNVRDTQLPARDIAGNPRVFAGELSNVDVGAYEFQGNPENRKPCIVNTEDQYTQVSQRKKLTVHFIDVDKTDVHTINISTNNVNVSVENKSGNASGSTYELLPADEWEGIAEIYVRVEDDKTNFAVDTFNLIVSEYYCGSITENTIWDADTIKVACDVTVEENATLTILPGTVVTFDDYAQLKISGRLLAVGTDENRIIFTSSDPSDYPGENYMGWRGIRFYGPGSADTSILEFCTIQYAKGRNQNYTGDEYGGGLFFDDWHKASVSHCIIHNNSAVERGGGVYCRGGGLYTSASSVRFENNIISNNQAERGGGIYLSRGNINPNTNYLINNIVCNNYALNGGGIYCDGLYCFNNIIANNEANVGGGLFINDNSVEVVNSVLWGNVATASFTSSDQIRVHWSDHLNMYHNVIEGGLDGIDSEDAIDNNECLIEQNPEFISPSLGAGIDYNGLTADWSLAANSPCINKGSVENGYNFEFLSADIRGEERILMDTIDIGAYEFRNSAPVKTGEVPDQHVHAERTCEIHIPVNGIFSDGNAGDIFTYTVSAIDAPAWLNIEMVPENIYISGTPGSNDLGITEAILMATDLFGEEIADTFEIEVLEATLIESISDNQFTIYPVPADEIIYLQSPEKDLINCSVEFFDIDGKMIKTSGIIENNILKLNVSSLSPGFYYLKIWSDDHCMSYKIVII